MTEAHRLEWNEAMTWWRSQSQPIQHIIRTLASNKLVEDGAEEVGSSDVNCAVFSMYQEFKGSGSPEIMDFLVDYSVT